MNSSPETQRPICLLLVKSAEKNKLGVYLDLHELAERIQTKETMLGVHLIWKGLGLLVNHNISSQVISIVATADICYLQPTYLKIKCGHMRNI
jgi:hypothetical protein